MNNRPSDERNVPDEQHVQAHTHDTSADFHQETLEFANVVNAQNAELQEYARVFLLKAMRLRGVAVKREQFLRAELRRHGLSDRTIAEAIALTPIQAGVDQEILDSIASRAVRFETNKSSVISFTSGLPGGLTMFAMVPADLLQYFIHAFRIIQKVAYTYGWKDLLGDVDEVDDGTFQKMTLLLGLMMGLSKMTSKFTAFTTAAGSKLGKSVASKPLTQTTWYVPLKTVLHHVGINITKDTVGKSISKAVPVLGGIISGGMTFATLTAESNRLKKHLRELPPPGIDAEEFKNLREGKLRNQAATDTVEDISNPDAAALFHRNQAADTVLDYAGKFKKTGSRLGRKINPRLEGE